MLRDAGKAFYGAAASGVLARERKRMANPTPRELKLIRFYPIEIGVRDKITGDTAFVDFKSVRDAARRLSIIQKFYSPVK